MSLTPNFELTPRQSDFYAASNDRAYLYINGANFGPTSWSRRSFESQYVNDEIRFDKYTCADPTLDYTQAANYRLAPYVRLSFDLGAFGPQKELALVFGFEVQTDSRVLVFSQAGALGDEALVAGDQQLLIEVEDLGYYQHLWFIHVRLDNSPWGGTWFFRGITGYVI